MSDDYLLVINGKPQGPFNIEQLKQFNIKPADFVKTGNMIDYKQAHEVAELRGLRVLRIGADTEKRAVEAGRKLALHLAVEQVDF